MIRALSHANIRLRDIDRCLPFYTDVLGLTITLDERGQQLSQRVTDRRRAVFLRWGTGPGQSFVVLQCLPDDGGSVAEPDGFRARLSAMGLNHFGFWVDDLEPILARATKAGVTMVRDAVVTCTARHYGYDDSGGAPCVLTAQMADPEGNVIQLDQWIAPGG